MDLYASIINSVLDVKLVMVENYANTIKFVLFVYSVEEARYANIIDGVPSVKIAVVVIFVYIISINKHVKSVIHNDI